MENTCSIQTCDNSHDFKGTVWMWCVFPLRIGKLPKLQINKCTFDAFCLSILYFLMQLSKDPEVGLHACVYTCRLSACMRLWHQLSNYILPNVSLSVFSLHTWVHHCLEGPWGESYPCVYKCSLAYSYSCNLIDQHQLDKHCCMCLCLHVFLIFAQVSMQLRMYRRTRRWVFMHVCIHADFPACMQTPASAE